MTQVDVYDKNNNIIRPEGILSLTEEMKQTIGKKNKAKILTGEFYLNKEEKKYVLGKGNGFH